MTSKKFALLFSQPTVFSQNHDMRSESCTNIEAQTILWSGDGRTGDCTGGTIDADATVVSVDGTGGSGKVLSSIGKIE